TGRWAASCAPSSRCACTACWGSRRRRPTPHERLGLSPRKARALVALERKTWEAPALLAAYREGQLSWLRALALLPVLDEENAPAWIGRAQAVTVRRLVDEVEWVVERRAAGAAPAASAPPPPGTTLVL